jgi:hypothetical protein
VATMMSIHLTQTSNTPHFKYRLMPVISQALSLAITKGFSVRGRVEIRAYKTSWPGTLRTHALAWLVL